MHDVPDPTQWDFGFIEYYREAIALYKDPDDRSRHLHLIKYCEAQRDFHTPSLRHINHLIQIDEKPNIQLTEPEWELYKISISFQPICKLYIILIDYSEIRINKF